MVALDPGGQVIALVLNGMLTAAGLLVLWLIRQVYRSVKHLLTKVDHIDECLDRTQEEMKAAIRETQEDIKELKAEARQRSDEHVRFREEIAYLKAKQGIPLDQPIGVTHDPNP